MTNQIAPLMIQKSDVPAGVALQELLRYVKANWLEEVSGICRNNYSAAIRGMRNGKPYHISERDLEPMNKALEEMGTQTFYANLSLEANDDAESITFGQTTAEQMKTLSGKLRLVELLSDTMDVKPHFIKNKFLSTTHNNYNRFTDQEVRQMNEVVRNIGLKMLSIRMV